MLFYFDKNTINGGGGGGGGVAFHNSGHRLALGHVNDNGCLEKVCLICFFTSYQQSF